MQSFYFPIINKNIRIDTEDKYIINIIKKKFVQDYSNSETFFHVRLLYSNSFHHTINFKKRYAEFRVVNSNLFPIDKSITAFLSNLLVLNNCLVFHASSVIDRGKTVIFSGPQGSGKTTISKLSNLKLVSDDTLIVYFEENSFFASSSPFEKQKILWLERKLPISNFYLINQSKILNNIETLPLVYKIKKIKSHLFGQFFPLGDEVICKKQDRLLLKFIQKVKIKKLHFTKTRDFLNLI